MNVIRKVFTARIYFNLAPLPYFFPKGFVRKFVQLFYAGSFFYEKDASKVEKIALEYEE